MLPFLARNRVLSAIIAAGVLLLFLMVRIFQASQPALVGEFTLPPMAGWSRHTDEKDGASKVRYDSNVDGNKLFISMACVPPGAKGPKTLQEMQSEFAASRSEIAGLAAQVGATGAGFGAATYQPTTLNGLPAVLVKEKWGGSSTTEVKSLLFVKGGNSYTLMSMLTPPTNFPSSPEADNQLSDAWQTLSSAVRP